MRQQLQSEALEQLDPVCHLDRRGIGLKQCSRTGLTAIGLYVKQNNLLRYHAQIAYFTRTFAYSIFLHLIRLSTFTRVTAIRVFTLFVVAKTDVISYLAFVHICQIR